MPSPIPIGGGNPPVPGLTCAQAKANIASLTLTVANLTKLLATTTDPTQRADIQAGITQGNEELAVLRSELPLVCGAPAPPPVEPIPVLIVADGDDFSFTGTPDVTDGVFTLSQFISALTATATTNPLSPLRLTFAHRQTDPGVSGQPLPSNVINNAYFTWQSSTVPAGAPSPSPTLPLNAVDLSEFRVVLLFGVQSLAEITPTAAPGAPPLTSAEVFQALQNKCLAWDGSFGEEQLWAFVTFMENGGGVFAAGDHEDLGAPMCGAIPRVRAMRRWLFSAGGATEPATIDGTVDSTSYDTAFLQGTILAHPANRAPYANLGMRCAPPALGSARHDTLQGSPITVTDEHTDLPVSGVPFDYQSDAVPQPLTVLASHPIFALPGGGQLAIMPDHMHEGMTIDLSDFDGTVPVTTVLTTGNPAPAQTYTHTDLETNLTATVAEFPSIGGVSQAQPQILATVTTTGGHETPSTEEQHVGSLDVTGPSVAFGAVTAYDGSPDGVGRIVVQSTFHHFFDINIIGDRATDVTDPQSKLGFTAPAGQAFLAQFQQYWVNLVMWLANPATAAQVLVAAVDRARGSVSVRKLASPAAAAHGEAVHDLGEVVTRLADRHVPAPLLRDAVHHAMPAAQARGVAKWLADAEASEPGLGAAVDRVLLHGFMGGAVLHGLSYPREQRLAADVEAFAPHVVQAGLRGAAEAVASSRHRHVAEDLIGHLTGALQVG